MRIWQSTAALLAVLLLAACQPITAPGGTIPPAGGTVPPAQEPSDITGLTGVTWEWQRTQTGDGDTITVAQPSRYTLTFHEDGMVDVQFDCNSGGGSYTVAGDRLTFGAMITTLMGCPEDSQADAFSDGLNSVTRYTLEGDSLTLGLAGGGEMIFHAAGAAAAATPAATEEAAGETGEGALVGVTWQWTETQYGDGSVVAAADPTRYTLTFQPDGSLQAQVDCNRGMGSYTVDGSSLTLGPLATTRMACPEGSQADVFLKDLEAVATFVFDGPNLVLNMKFDSGNIVFAPAE